MGACGGAQSKAMHMSSQLFRPLQSKPQDSFDTSHSSETHDQSLLLLPKASLLELLHESLAYSRMMIVGVAAAARVALMALRRGWAFGRCCGRSCGCA
eukprot:1488693-Amphidinium_carterae.1